MNDSNSECLFERRTNTHQQMLVDVGVVLRRSLSCEYTREFLESVRIPEGVIARVLAKADVRPGTHIKSRIG
ncbi:hypothetical protein [Telluria aromaticivorans]|uniref:Uncharacterized protein n=1 Tax=Telluria aromaticivorans TaxID=2725995 RepID=A0A7Y2JX50_9BURK|nr:hypothetical protein [Telluria aromaticivorans]NNG22651.1 hypothetical protein [Telluria aromaticivorans]